MSKLEELKKFLADNKDDKEVSGYVAGLSAVSADKVKTFLDTEDGKKFHQPMLDAYYTKAHKSWEEKNLEKIKADAVAVSKNETPEQKKIRELEESVNAEKQARIRESLKNKSVLKFKEKGVPENFADLISASDEADLEVKVGKVSELFNTYKEQVHAEFQKKHGIKPTQTCEEDNMTQDEKDVALAMEAAGLK
jgi:hypothetical protein